MSLLKFAYFDQLILDFLLILISGSYSMLFLLLRRFSSRSYILIPLFHSYFVQNIKYLSTQSKRLLLPWLPISSSAFRIFMSLLNTWYYSTHQSESFMRKKIYLAYIVSLGHGKWRINIYGLNSVSLESTQSWHIIFAKIFTKLKWMWIPNGSLVGEWSVLGTN
jgi:hypothetical protein